ncbi:hypothetical protein ABH920_001227 [Catenulispora sp. EB89]|uniref:hypothetical protein n=1 Tax=Catenulispora sp. EB89 TaxID=3156257 RepID=UPI003517357A
MFSRAGISLAAAGLLAAGLAAYTAGPAAATVLKSQCTWSGGNGPLYSATCTGVAPTDHWDVALTCSNQEDTYEHTYYGGIKEGSGTGYAECQPGQIFAGWDIRNL